ncbi:hypothetical protein BS78_07G066300 [Paspalum vaginatum]|nr:hypothetical protein BS78_07G066300 [Paspalum vaginatum]
MADPEVTIKMTAAAATAAKASTRAYVTFLEGDGDESWKRVVELAKGLRKVGSAYRLVVAVLPGLPESFRQSLLSEGCILREIEPVVYPHEDQAQQFSMLRTWEFVEFERVVYLDASIIIQGVPDNIDKLFALEKGRFYAVTVGMNSSSGDKAPTHTHTTAGHGRTQYKQVQVGYYLQTSDEQAERRVVPSPLYHFKADMFVYEPGMATAEALLEALSVWPRSALAADQQVDDFLCMFFGDRYERVLLEKEDEVLVDINMPPNGGASVVMYDDNDDAWVWDEAPAGALLADHLRRQLLPFAGVVALSAAVNGLAAGPGSTAAAFGLFSLFLGGMFLVILHVLRRVASADDE